VFAQQGQCSKKKIVFLPDKASVVPTVDKVLRGKPLDVRKIGEHSIRPFSRRRGLLSGESEFNGISVSMNVAALSLVGWNAMRRIEFEALRYGQHAARSRVSLVWTRC
jgi:hypothetical protein